MAPARSTGATDRLRGAQPETGLVTRTRATKAIEAIRSNSPAPVELTRLREELDRLKSANAALQERLDRFERKSKKD